MDLIKKLQALPSDWRGGYTSSAAELEIHRTTLHGYVRDGRIEPDVVRGARSYFSKACLLRFAKGWFANPDRGVKA